MQLYGNIWGNTGYMGMYGIIWGMHGVIQGKYAVIWEYMG